MFLFKITEVNFKRIFNKNKIYYEIYNKIYTIF